MTQVIRDPMLGEPIYLPTSLHVYRGMDDFEGGLCTITRIKEGVSAGKSVPFVQVKENLGLWYNWNHLVDNQDTWKKKYEGKRGIITPDFRRKYNYAEADWRNVHLVGDK